MWEIPMRKICGKMGSADVRHIVAVVALVATMALPKLSRKAIGSNKHKMPLVAAMVGHLRPRRKFPAVGPNRPGPAVHRNDEQAVLEAIRRISRMARTEGHNSLKRGGISPAQLAALRALDNPAAVSMNELAERTMTSPSSASEVVARLVAQGLVARNRSAVDGRSVELSLTDAGRTAVVAGSEFNDTLRAGLQKMALRDRRRLSRLLGQLLGKIGAHSTPGDSPAAVEQAIAEIHSSHPLPESATA